jgi:hypothetical protein
MILFKHPLSVEADRFDHEVEFVGGVDFARYAVGHAGPDELGFAEAVAPINALRVVVLEQDTAYDHTPSARQGKRRLALKLDTEGTRSVDQWDLRSIDSAVDGLRGGLLRKAGYRHGAALQRC